MKTSTFIMIMIIIAVAGAVLYFLVIKPATTSVNNINKTITGGTSIGATIQSGLGIANVLLQQSNSSPSVGDDPDDYMD